MYTLVTSLDISLKQIQLYEVSTEISHELTKYFRFVAFTSQDIYMIFTVKVVLDMGFT